MKTYRGKRDKETGLAIVEVVEDDCVQPLVHQCRHSPDGFEWGYGGSGPADLARSILCDAMNYDPPPHLYQAFKFAYVAAWDEEWIIEEPEIWAWILTQTERSNDNDDAVGQL